LEPGSTLENKIINTALCSIGMSGVVFHAPFIITHPHFKLYAIWEREKNITIEKYPGTIQYRSIDEMLSDDDIDLVIVNTPNVTHFEFAKKALEAGKHVVIEKPFTPTVEQCEFLIALAKEKNKILTVYHNRRFDSEFLAIKKLLEEKSIGEIREAEFHYDRFDENLSYKLHKEINHKGTGSLYDLGSHLVDQALVLFGWPEYVFADIFAMRPVSKVDDYFEVLLYYKNFRVRLKASYQVREAIPAFVLHGSKGSFIKYRSDVQERNLLSGKMPDEKDWGLESLESAGVLITELNGTLIREKVVSPKGDYMRYYDSLYRSICFNEPFTVSAEEGMNVIKIIEAAFKSSQEKRVIKLA
jgi:predicted dehydrogenase